jgi:L-2,4-diaminobutyrate decarboxylase
LLLEPQLSVVLFEVDGWSTERYHEWTRLRAADGVALITPTTWRGRTCYRVCLVNPRTTNEMLESILADMLAFGPG